MYEKEETFIVGFAASKESEKSSIYLRLVEERTTDWLVYHSTKDYVEVELFDNFKEKHNIVYEYHYKVPSSHVTRVLKCSNKWINKHIETTETFIEFVKSIIYKKEISSDTFICNEYFYEILTELGKNKYIKNSRFETLEDIHGIVETFNDNGVLTYFRKTEGY